MSKVDNHTNVEDLLNKFINEKNTIKKIKRYLKGLYII